MTVELSPSDVASFRARIEELFRALNAHDVDAVVALHAPDAVLRDPRLPHPVRGRWGIAEELSGIFRAFPDIQWPQEELRVYAADARRAAAQWRLTATMTGRLDPPGLAPTGRSTSIDGVCLYEFENEPASGSMLLNRHVVVYDALGMLQDLGLMPRLDSNTVKVMAGVERAVVQVGTAIHNRTEHRHEGNGA